MVCTGRQIPVSRAKKEADAQVSQATSSILTRLETKVKEMNIEALLAEHYGKHDPKAKVCDGCEAGQAIELFRAEILDLIKGLKQGS
jgi:hypothetical protein